jgi:hypothetical protein
MIESYFLEEDVRIICVEARSFPHGIRAAFNHLEKKFADMMNRDLYGISCKNPEGNIIYKAAVSELTEGEAEKAGLESFVVPKGEYLAETIVDWRKNVEGIGDAFQELLEDPRLDKDFPCVEWYKSLDEVVCMIRTDPARS